MNCPNCNSPIEKDGKICLHCVSQLSNEETDFPKTYH